MYALADCNKFYTSYERVFTPKLKGIPVVVLSNNDGCVIARSDQARALGISMGVPSFLIGDVVQKHGIMVYSTNCTRLFTGAFWTKPAICTNAHLKKPSWKERSEDNLKRVLKLFKTSKVIS